MPVDVSSIRNRLRAVTIAGIGLSLAVGLHAQRTAIRGTVDSPLADVPVRVWSMKLHVGADGRVRRAVKQDIFARSVAGETVLAGAKGAYHIEVDAGAHSVFAFADVDGDGRWDPQTPEPFGWYAAQPSGRFDFVKVGAAQRTEVDFTLRAARPFPVDSRSAPGGKLCHIKGYPVLQLHGDARARGFAHGKLIAAQIVDFFRFYILEEKLRSASAYETGFAKFLGTHFAMPKPFIIECEAVIEGMSASGVDLRIAELGRDFALVDLLAINAYIETRAMRSSCTQFAAWGSRTKGTDVDGGMITGRNMDGEIDIRKVTVSHFLLFAVHPSEAGQKRYVSMMWPGFVATISGINEEGFYTMENAGGTGPGPVVDQLVPISWAMRESLARLGRDATPASVQALVDSFDNSVGGTCGPGCIMLFATPYHGQADPAFVFEGDRFGDAIRRAGDVRPLLEDAIVLSNHHHVYGADVDRPGTYFGRQPGFSSHWRYEAGMHKLEAWHRIGRKIGSADMRELLQTVAHGTTEYAIITRPNTVEFDVAVASLEPELWDAPYREWTTFEFADLFPRAKRQGQLRPPESGRR